MRFSLLTIAWLVSFGLYLLMVGQVSWSEGALGAVLSFGAVAMFAWSVSVARVRIHVRRRMIAPVRRLPLAVAWESALVFWALLRKLLGHRVFGTTVSVPFTHTGHHPTSVGWRVIAVFGVSVSPNSYVADVDMDDHTIHIRQLVGRTLSKGDREFLEQPT
jgi:hypothetical protein